MAEEKRKAKPFDVINAISSKKKIEHPEDFSVFLTNRYFSAHPDTIDVAFIMNHSGTGVLPPEAILDFYNEVIPKGKRFYPFPKNHRTPEEIKTYQIHYTCSEEAFYEDQEILKLLKEKE